MRSMPKLIFNKSNQLRTKPNKDFQLKLRAQMAFCVLDSLWRNPESVVFR